MRTRGMRIIEIDVTDDNKFQVSWISGLQPTKRRLFDNRDDAEAFAHQKMGATGMIISTLDMSPEKLAAHMARLAPTIAASSARH